ncbi:MAG: fatty acid desaturase [Kiloniellales bacterium]
MEWPTVGLAIALYAAFGLLTWYHALLPWWALVIAGGYLVALHGSLQHEAAHGHPTPWPLVNEALVFPSLWLWLPFRAYQRSHLEHHDDAYLTDPLADPESYYVTPERWTRLGGAARALLWVHNTVAGRLLLGPFLCLWSLLRAETVGRAQGHGTPQGTPVRDWLRHAIGVAMVLVWVLWACGMPLVEFLAFVVYPGISLTLLRSFLEHQARGPVGERTGLIEAGPLFSLLYLNNNLHALHHAEPNLAWYRLPARYRQCREALLAQNGGYRLSGYGEVIARYLLWPKELPVYPLAATAATALPEPPARGAGPLRESPAFAPAKHP